MTNKKNKNKNKNKNKDKGRSRFPSGMTTREAKAIFMKRWLLLMVAVLVARGGWAQGGTHLDQVLAAMDASSAKFRSAEAEFQWDFFERVVKSTSSQTGTIYFERAGRGTEMGAKIVQPAPKVLSYKGAMLQVFDPVADTLIRIAAKNNQGQYESFLTLGFGGSGSDLKKQWTVTDGSTETVDGVSCAKLDLVSMDPNVKAMFTHVTIWVDLTRDVLLKQMFFTPSDDVRTAYYRKIKYNAKVDASVYAIKTDKKTSVTNR